MNTAKKLCETDEDGVLHVAVPIGKPHCRFEVVLVWDELEDGGVQDLVGLLRDTPIERPPQGSYEARDELK